MVTMSTFGSFGKKQKRGPKAPINLVGEEEFTRFTILIAFMINVVKSLTYIERLDNN